MVRLRAPLASDAQLFLDFLNDTDLQSVIGGSLRVHSMDMAEKWIAGKLQDPAARLLVIESEDSAVGYIQIVSIDWISRHGTLGLCLKAEFRNRGIGTEAVTLAKSYASKALNLRKLLLTVRSDNLAAEKVYLKLGFSEVGRLRDHVWSGKERWADLCVMEIFL